MNIDIHKKWVITDQSWSPDVDDLFVREDLLDRYHVDDQKVKEFPDVFSFDPPATDKEMNKAEL